MDHFVHSLVRIQKDEKLGWCAPAELGESTPNYISFAVPVDNHRALFEQYACEAVKAGREGERRLTSYVMTRSGKDAFLLKVANRDLWFVVREASKREGALQYIGRLQHPDFAHRLTEIEPVRPSLLDELCEAENTFLIGCEPFTHYAGLKTRETG